MCDLSRSRSARDLSRGSNMRDPLRNRSVHNPLHDTSVCDPYIVGVCAICHAIEVHVTYHSTECVTHRAVGEHLTHQDHAH